MKYKYENCVFGEWTVLNGLEKGYYEAICSCGNRKKVYITNLTSGKSTNCGCIQAQKTKERSTTHGMSSTEMADLKVKKEDIQMEVYKKLMQVQCKLKAPKNQMNKFGGYKYRSCEDILEALKPLLLEVKASIVISDDIILINDRYYVKSTVKFIDVETGEIVETSALAREEESKKGMDSSQLTGSTSSYARKYALNGLFAIDDTKDSDFTNTHGKDISIQNNVTNKTNNATQKTLSEKQLTRMYALGAKAGYNSTQVKEQVFRRFKTEPKYLSKTDYDTVCNGYEAASK